MRMPSPQLGCLIKRWTSTAAASLPALAGSAPPYTRHLIVHTPQPSSSWPPRLDAASPLVRQLEEAGFKKSDGKLGIGVAVAPSLSESGSSLSSSREWTGKNETFHATLYPDFVDFQNVTIETIDTLVHGIVTRPLPSSTPATDTAKRRKTHIYVCTHGARDCRCGILGSTLVESLRELVRTRVRPEEDGDVEVREVAHVGGHKFAANALVYRDGGRGCDWYGLLRASDAPRLLNLAIDPNPASSKWYPRWRGALGVSPEDARALVEREGKGVAQGRRTEVRRELGEETREINFVSWDGEDAWALKGWQGESVMEVAKRHDLPSILATCGGHCECATCHVVFKGSTDPPVPALGDEEEEQLDFALGRTDGSRLGCQIQLSKELEQWCADGGVISLPQY